jgi:hypothetical protein
MTDGPSGTVVEKLADGSTSIRGPGGAWITVNPRTHDVMYMRAGGFLVGEMMARALATLDEVAPAQGDFTLVVDAEAQSGYEPAVRAFVTAWLARRRDQLRPCHMLARAPLVRMGAQMINAALNAKVIQVHQDRIEFEQSVGAVIRDSQRMRAARGQ